MFRGRHEVRDEELSAYADAELPPEARARVERHLAGCPACREKLTELTSLRSALRALPGARAPRSFALREADVRPAPARPAVPAWATPALSAVAVASFVAFGVLVGVDAGAFETTGDEDADFQAVPAAEETLEVDLGQPDAAQESGGNTTHALPTDAAPKAAGHGDDSLNYEAGTPESSFGPRSSPPSDSEADDGDGGPPPTSDAQSLDESRGQPALDRGLSPTATARPAGAFAEPRSPRGAADGESAPEGGDASVAGSPADDGGQSLRSAQAATLAAGVLALVLLAVVWQRSRRAGA